MPIRPATAEDAGQIASVRVASWQVVYRGLIPDRILDALSVSATAARVMPRLLDPTRSVFVYEELGHVVGFVMFGPSRDDDADAGRVGEIYVIYLRPEQWGKGIGASLCAKALTGLRQLGFVEVTLWVLRDNRRAIRFYEAAGFRVDGATQDLVRDGFTMHEVRFRQRLGETVA